MPFQISQRADFFEEEVGLETTLKRPIVNTRDEPHCDATKYRRLHVIVGDANMSEVATYLKVGATAIVLAMIEDDALGDDLAAGQPGVGASARSATTRRCSARSCCADGRRVTALEMQWGLLERARKYERSHGLGGGRRGASAPTCSTRWEHVLAGLEARSLDRWPTGRLGGQAAARRRHTPTDTASRPATPG